eukprot:TRINITY_DN58931_c0_g2_i1.p1 TRINITY_DN58931_c0_g2~~TRINITY_DN58931_c0_g2_i1.p1  ORF type:complete len:185 (-),score=7.81 TRINITY_DN58931_c0_g2_i1:190-744(-)
MVENVEYTVDLLSSVVKIEYAKKVPAAAKLKVFLLKTSVDPNEFTLLSLEDGTTMPITEEQIAGIESGRFLLVPKEEEAGSPQDHLRSDQEEKVRTLIREEISRHVGHAPSPMPRAHLFRTPNPPGLPSSSYHQPDYNEAGSPYDKTVPRGAAVYQDPTTHRFYWYRRGQARNVPFDWIYMGVK